MLLVSVNVGQKRTQLNGGKVETTGIYKIPAAGPIQITNQGIPDDFIGDLKHHGGPDQAVYVYGSRDYDWWQRELGRPLDPGTFGENLTISGMESAGLKMGDRLLVGAVVLEVTAPRIPCSTFATRMGDVGFSKRYRDAERPGAYCRVVEGGTIGAGLPVQHVEYEGDSVSILELFREHYQHEKDERQLQRILRAPIAARTRAAIERSLERLPADRTD